MYTESLATAFESWFACPAQSPCMIILMELLNVVFPCIHNSAVSVAEAKHLYVQQTPLSLDGQRAPVYGLAFSLLQPGLGSPVDGIFWKLGYRWKV